MTDHIFKNKTLEAESLTHKSFGRPHNERLEWLGDSILNAAVSEMLWRRFPQVGEGALTELRASLVRNESLARAARRVGLPPKLRLGAGEDASRGREKDSILAAAFEARIAAVKLDGGDPRALAESALADELESRATLMRESGENALKSEKTRLQEMLQKAGKSPPEYVVLRENRGSRESRFEVECEADGKKFPGAGKSVSAAEKNAATKALSELQQ